MLATVARLSEAMRRVRRDARRSTSGTRGCRSSRRSPSFTAGVDPKRVSKRASRHRRRRARKDSMHAFAKLTDIVDGEPRIISDPPLIVPIDELAPGHDGRREPRSQTQLRDSDPRLPADARDRPPRTCSSSSDSSTWPARWSASAASARAPGSRCCSASTTRIRCSCRSRRRSRRCSSSSSARATYSNHGQRVVAGQRLMQATSDIFLGWQHVATGLDGQRARLLRPPAQGLEGLRSPSSRRPAGRHGAPTASCAAGRSPAPTPAPATGSRSPPTSARATRSTGRSPTFAETYADQNERDYQALEKPSTQDGSRPRWVCDFLAQRLGTALCSGASGPTTGPGCRGTSSPGITLAALAIPEVMGYTKIAGTPGR